MSDGNLDRLLASPYENETEQRNWWPLIVGVLIGAISVSGIFALVGEDAVGDERPVAVPGSSVPATSSTTPDRVAPEVEPLPFPPGYVAISETEAVKPHHILRNGDQLFISMTTAYARGLNPVTEPLFLGGSWTLDTINGEAIESEGTVFDDNPISSDQILGVASAAFTVPSDSVFQPKQLRLIERWDAVEQTESARIPIDSWPFYRDESISLPFEGFTFHLDTLAFEPYGIETTWTIDGDSGPHRIVKIETSMMGPDGSQIATAEPGVRMGRTSGFGETTRIELAILPGRLVLNTPEDFDAFYEDELGQTKELLVTVTVTTANPVPVDDVSIDLIGLPFQNADEGHPGR